MIKHRLCKISIGMVLNLINFVYIVIFHVEAGLENVKLAILERRFSDILQKSKCHPCSFKFWRNL